MAIEIKEVVLRAVIEQKNQPESDEAASCGDQAMEPSPELIQVCVDEVLRIMKSKHRL